MGSKELKRYAPKDIALEAVLVSDKSLESNSDQISEVSALGSKELKKYATLVSDKSLESNSD